jgi:hypothetical protein
MRAQPETSVVLHPREQAIGLGENRRLLQIAWQLMFRSEDAGRHLQLTAAIPLASKTGKPIKARS